MNKILLKLYFQIKNLCAEDAACLNHLSATDRAKVEAVLANMENFTKTPKGLLLVQSIHLEELEASRQKIEELIQNPLPKKAYLNLENPNTYYAVAIKDYPSSEYFDDLSNKQQKFVSQLAQIDVKDWQEEAKNRLQIFQKIGTSYSKNISNIADIQAIISKFLDMPAEKKAQHEDFISITSVQIPQDTTKISKEIDALKAQISEATTQGDISKAKKIEAKLSEKEAELKQHLVHNENIATFQKEATKVFLEEDIAFDFEGLFGINSSRNAGGHTTVNPKNGKLVLSISNNSIGEANINRTKIHEMRHLIQYNEGKLGFIVINKKAISFLYDYTDEIEAYAEHKELPSPSYYAHLSKNSLTIDSKISDLIGGMGVEKDNMTTFFNSVFSALSERFSEVSRDLLEVMSLKNLFLFAQKKNILAKTKIGYHFNLPKDEKYNFQVSQAYFFRVKL